MVTYEKQTKVRFLLHRKEFCVYAEANYNDQMPILETSLRPGEGQTRKQRDRLGN